MNKINPVDLFRDSYLISVYDDFFD